MNKWHKAIFIALKGDTEPKHQKCWFYWFINSQTTTGSGCHYDAKQEIIFETKFKDSIIMTVTMEVLLATKDVRKTFKIALTQL